MSQLASRSCGLLRGVMLSAVLAVATATTSFAQTLDNKGKEFIISFLPNYSTPDVELHLNADVPTDVTVEYPVNSPTFSQVVNLVPGTISIVSLPVDAAQDWNVNVAQNNAIRASATQEFGVYMVNRAPFTSDAALGLPVDTMNNEYIISTYNEAFLAAQFVVTAAFDNTTVTITPSRDLQGGQLAGVPFNVVLSRGQGYMVRQESTGTNGGLAGSIVSSDKPVGVTNGNGCTQVPIGTSACDTIFEVAHPLQTWSTEAAVVNLPDRPNGTIYRIIASVDGTVVSQDGVAVGTINRSEFLEVGPLAGSHVFSGSNAIFVTQYMTGKSSPGATTGDPAMGNMIPTAQFQKAYTFSTVGGGQFAEHFLTLIANNSDVGTLLLDGAPVSAAEFTAIPGTNFSSAVLSLPEGTHISSSTNPHGITVEGYNSFDSYLYPGGASFQFINPVGDTNIPACSVTLTSNPKGFVGLAFDNRPSEDVNGNKVLDAGEDLNNNSKIDKDTGVFFVELLNGASNAVLAVDPFVPGAAQVSFTISVPDQAANSTGTIRVTDGAGNICIAELGVVDCAGVPNGTKTLDRCGVCGGDGNSCLGCKDVSLSGAQFKLDGNARSQRNLVQRAARGLKGKKNQAFAASAVAQAESLYNQSWELVWKLPSETKSCTNTSFCVSTATSDTKSVYSSNTAALQNLLTRVLDRKYGGKNYGGLGRSLVRQSNALAKESKNQASKIPATLSACS